MELFTLLIHPTRINAERMTVSLQEAMRLDREHPAPLDLRIVPLPGGTGIVCDLSPGASEQSRPLRTAASRVLAQTMIDSYEETLVQRFIDKEVGDSKHREEGSSVMAHCRQLLHDGDDPHPGAECSLERRTAKLAALIEGYLEEERLFHLEGFLHFRAASYLEELRDTVSYAVDEWMVERQYQEFIALLKYFVYIQEAKIPVVHLLHKGNHDFVLLNEHMKPIDTKQMDEFVAELIDKDINYEDVIVSTLISVSPGRLVIHTAVPEQQVIRTIVTIFEGRAEVCSDCHMCLTPLEERKR